MAVTIRPEHREDETVFHYVIHQCSGLADESGAVHVQHHHVCRLPLLPKTYGNEVMGEAHVEEFDVPGQDVKVAFVIGSWKETGAGERMFEIRGPYGKCD